MVEAAIRPLDVRDLRLLHRVRRDGLCLHAQVAYTRGPHALQTALLDVLTPGRATHTLVARPLLPDDPAAVGQITHDLGDSVARLGFIGPTAQVDGPVGLRLLDALSQEAGLRGAHNLIAEVDEDQPAFEGLRRAGFAVYARQQIWRWQGTPPPEQEYDVVWRSESPADGEAIAWLVANLVPGLVLQVEAAPGRNRRGLLHWAEGELRAYLDLERGPRGIWAQAYIHPAVEAIDMLLAAFLRRVGEVERPLYLCLRSYQVWMVAALDRLGFEKVAEQAVMVRRLAATVRRAVPAPLPAINGGRVEPTTPFAGTTLESLNRPSR
ncbi:MAG TPA: hypothetical protein VK449_08935 [Anaerolineales bacterium]|nr:hypothetical protein [Anaerolineales bacterium]